ncbi:Miro-like protein [Beggiatoa alba B18LD]|uniref:non-specific serine/threonine protein kinase n=1 Tax=Beggiatoa alba B18LD TaxID=395493 RepID=I3CE34_9GAMM|nr:COR domain-containing protein [Beggiatoa alba]EIJ41877.1 Miro-like protein [Beggiatoa alba B18LD]
MDRKELEQKLRDLNDPWKCAAFAAKMALLALPVLAIEADKKGFLWFWKKSERQKYLLAILRAEQLGWCATYLESKEIARAVATDHAVAIHALNAVINAPSLTTHASAVGAVAAVAEVATTTIIAAGIATIAPDTSGNVITFDTNENSAAFSACLVAINIDAVYVAYSIAHIIAIFIEFLEKGKKTILLEQPSKIISPKLHTHFIQGLKELGHGFDTYWLNWYQDRLAGKPLNPKTLAKQVLLSPEYEALSPAEINARLLSQWENPEQETLNRVRVIFLGYGEAGKTSLIRALFNEPVIENKEAMTAGIDIREWDVPNAKIKAHFWDFGGQVMAHATHQFFLRSRCLYVSLLNARTDINANQQVEYWLEHVKAFGGDSKVMLVGNKSDLTQVNLDMHRLNEKYPQRLVNFYPLSCTQYQDAGKHQRYFEIFKTELIEQLQAMEIYQTRFTAAEFNILQILRTKSVTSAFLSKTDYTTLCNQEGIQTTADFNQDSLLKLFDALGVIIHFPKITRLNDYVLNPRWLTYGVYTLIYGKTAHLTEQQAHAILTTQKVVDHEGNELTYSCERYWVILEAMKEFELCYELPQKPHNYVIPDLLPSDQPQNLQFDRATAFRFDFDFEGFLPRHLTANFIVRQHHEIVDNLVWQNGVRLKSQSYQAQALAMADYHGRRWSLWVSGKDTVRYFSKLYDDVKIILARMTLTYSEWVWLPNAKNEVDSTGNMSRAGFKGLLALERARGKLYICEYGQYPLSEVLKFMTDEKRAEQQGGVNIEINTGGGDFSMGGDIVGRDKHHNIEQANNSENAQLLRLLQKLLTQLQQVKSTEETEAAKSFAQQAITEVQKEKPNFFQLKVTTKGLIEAAKAVALIYPIVMPIIEQIEALITKK